MMTSETESKYVRFEPRANGDLAMRGTGNLRRDAGQFRSSSEAAAQGALGEILEWHTHNGWEWVEHADSSTLKDLAE